jgi:hypothetical protein
MQTLEGVVVNGDIVLQPPQTLPEGSHVQVTVLASPTLAERLADLADEGREHRRIHGGRTKEEIDADLAEMRRDAEEEAREHEDLHDRAVAASIKRSQG